MNTEEIKNELNFVKSLINNGPVLEKYIDDNIDKKDVTSEINELMKHEKYIWNSLIDIKVSMLENKIKKAEQKLCEIINVSENDSFDFNLENKIDVILYSTLKIEELKSKKKHII